MQRESSAELTSKYGFSVVAPISVTSPSSTACSTESCCALLKRWISSMKRIVRSPFAPSRSRAARDDCRGRRPPARKRPRSPRTPRRSARPRCGRSSSCPCRAARRGSSTAAGPARSRAEARSPPEDVLLADELVERARRSRTASGAFSGLALRRGLGEEVSHAAKYAPAVARTRLRAGARGLLAADPRGRSASGLRALPEHRGAARAAEGAGRVGAPRRAPLPGDAPVLGALAEARAERRRRGGAADRGGRPPGRPSPSRPRVALHPLRDRRSSTCSSACRRGSTRRSARCSATDRASTPPAGTRCGMSSRGSGRPSTRARRAAGLSLADVYVQGREHEHLYRLAEALIELDEQAQHWRMRHYQVVARVIGDKVVGTQGTPVELLGRLVSKTSFPELWEVRNELTALSKASQGDVRHLRRCARRSRSFCRSCSARTPSTRRGTRSVAADILRDYFARDGIEFELLRARAGSRERRRALPRAATGRRSPSSPTPTRSSPIPPNGTATRGQAISWTTRCGDGARWT